METIILDDISHLDSLKRWLANMFERGTAKYFELLVDGKRVVYKTHLLDSFDEYKKWLTEFTQSLRILVYNTKNSHRAQVFELRTAKYVKGQSEKLYATRKRSLSEDEIEQRVYERFEEQKRSNKLSELATENGEIKKRLAEAEAYILELEKEKSETEKKNGFDWEGTIKMLLPAFQQQVSGIAPAQNDKAELNGNMAEQEAATFKMKEPETDIKDAEPCVLNDREKRDLTILQNAYTNLGEDHYSKLMNMICFLNDYPQFINAIDEQLMQTASQLGWKNA